MGPICTQVTPVDELIANVFTNLPENYQNHRWLCERPILATKNNVVNVINTQLLQQIPGNTQCNKSVDSVPDQTQMVNYPPDFLNSFEPPGVSPNYLSVKVGAHIMVLRNLDPPRLCNGTRLVVKKLMPMLLKLQCFLGVARVKMFHLRISMIPTDMPFEFKRLQFPFA
ncbi:uncharacterized protein LOC106470130 [Limulus polyphemus]|uniref:Uncharacterized protein LOC106470130 n=1 Tax=Limulus polyphemus TaxID=6850 RepID=A0ABM1BPF2_LIMPO|nr:uncharacterized protein LOC106470130 [Limulus polyphemus]